MGVEERHRLNAGGARRRESEDLAVQHAVDVHHDERRSPTRGVRAMGHPGAESHCLDGQEIPRVVVLLVELLRPSRQARIFEVL